MTTKIQKWGNSLAMRLPKELAESFNLRTGSRVNFVRKEYSFEVKPEIGIKKPTYTLTQLLKGMNKNNIPGKLIFPDDKPRGKEIW